MKQKDEKWNSERNISETKSLKSLAHNVLMRNTSRNKTETSTKKSETKEGKNSHFCFTHANRAQSVDIREYTQNFMKNLVSLDFLKKLSLKCRRCFNWQGGISKIGTCSLTKERKSHTDFCMDYNDTVGGVYAHSRRD